MQAPNHSEGGASETRSLHAAMFRIVNVQIEGEDASPIHLMSDFLLFPSGSAQLWDSLHPKAYLAAGDWCGMHELIYLKNRSLVAYSATDYSELDDRQKGRLLYGLMSELDGLFNTLWIFRDHAASVLPGWILDALSNRFVRADSSWPTCRCTGSTDVAVVQREEIESAKQLNRMLFPRGKSSAHRNTSEIVHGDQHRLGRSLRFIRAARSTLGSSVKLANYTFALESLLSWHGGTRYQNEGAKGRIGRIVASLVAQTPKARQFASEVVQEMFRVRDKVAHGQILGASQVERLGETVEKADHLLRMLIRAMIDNETTQPFICRRLSKSESRKFQEFLDGLGRANGEPN